LDDELNGALDIHSIRVPWPRNLPEESPPRTGDAESR